MRLREPRRVVITGLGAIAPCGSGVEDFWKGLHSPAEPAVNRTVDDFDPASIGLKHTEARRLERFAQLALAAAGQALADAGDLPYDPARRGVILGTGIGGAYTWESQAAVFREKGARGVSPLVVPMVMPNAASAAVSMRNDLRGPVETVTTACASGTHAIGNAAMLIAAGRADMMLAGGSESCQTDVMVNGFGNMKALSSTGISRPFDAERDGFCSAEGAGVLVLEDAESARARGARIYAEVVGAGSTGDAHHITAPAPDGRGAVACMRAAIDDAGLTPADITHVNAHGTSTPLNDAAEASAIREVFGSEPGPAVTSIKGVTGHALGAAGALEGVALALSFWHRSLPPTLGGSQLDPALGIDVVTSARSWEPSPAISNSFAFGGHNACVVFAPVA